MLRLGAPLQGGGEGCEALSSRSNMDFIYHTSSKIFFLNFVNITRIHPENSKIHSMHIIEYRDAIEVILDQF